MVCASGRPGTNKAPDARQEARGDEDRACERDNRQAQSKLDRPTKKFITTKEQDEAVYKEFSEYTSAAEKDFAETLRKLNAEQKAEVFDNLQKATKGVNPQTYSTSTNGSR